MASAVADKENAPSSGKLFSPSKYKAVLGGTSHNTSSSSTGGGVFGRLMQAKVAADIDRDATLAKVLARKQRLEDEAAAEQRAKEEAASAALAAKLQMEEKDCALAAELSAAEAAAMEKWKKEVATVQEEDKKLSAKMAAEEEERQKRLEELESQDHAFVRKMMKSEVKAMNKHIQQLAKQWRKPKIVCNNVQDGMLITVELPDVGELKVDVNTETKIINVNVAPDLKQFKALIESLPADLRPSAVDITLDLKIVGKESVSQDDIRTRYDAKEGKAFIFVRNACLSKENKAFFSRIRDGLRRVVSRRGSRRGSMVGESKNSKK